MKKPRKIPKCKTSTESILEKKQKKSSVKDADRLIEDFMAFLYQLQKKNNQICNLSES